jgi:hypothetical protein
VPAWRRGASHGRHQELAEPRAGCRTFDTRTEREDLVAGPATNEVRVYSSTHRVAYLARCSAHDRLTGSGEVGVALNEGGVVTTEAE